MIRKTLKMCFGGIAACVAIAAAPSSAIAASALEMKLSAIVSEAEKADKTDNYPLAAKRYLDALALAEDALPDKAPELKRKLADAYINWARTLYWKAKTDKNPEPMAKAIDLCAKAAEANPKLSRKCDVFVEKFKKDLKSLEYQKATSLDTLDPGREKRLREIAVLLKQGEVLEKDGQYPRALGKYKDVLALDPYNLEAAVRSKRVLRKIEEAGRKRREADRQEKNAENTWKYVKSAEAERATAMEEAVREYEHKKMLEDKLEKTPIPKLAFKDTPLDKALSQLEKMISGVVGKGFHFKYQGFNPADDKWPPITFQASNIPPKDALKAICDAMALDFSFNGPKEAVLKPK